MEEYIALLQHGGIGDQIIALPLIEAFRNDNLPVRVYTLFPEIAKLFIPWAEIKTREQIKIDNPPYYLDLIDTVRFRFTRSKHDEVFSLPDFIRPMYHSLMAKWPEWGTIIERHPGSCNQGGTKAVQQGLHRSTIAFHLLGLEPSAFKFDHPGVDESLLPSLGFKTSKFITIHDGFDESHKFEVSMKSWPVSYWESFVASFKKRFPDISVIQIGGKKHRFIKGVDQNLAGKLPFSESLSYLKSSLVHIDGDSGLVHARHLFNRPSVVVFGPTNVKYFGYPENVNINPGFCGDCWWNKNDWMRTCVNGYPRALCMESTVPGMVLDKVSSLIEGAHESSGC